MESTDDNKDNAAPQEPLYILKHEFGKPIRKGLLARVDIPIGARILCEAPLLTLSSAFKQGREQYIIHSLRGQPKHIQRAYFSLPNNYIKDKLPFCGIFKTNSLPCGQNSIVRAVYPHISQLNHSCLPNAHASWNYGIVRETVHAIHNIKAGEEITIGYDHGGSYPIRQNFLQCTYGFKCKCALCSLPNDELIISEFRRDNIYVLEDILGHTPTLINDPEKALIASRAILETFEKEHSGFAGINIPRIYYDAFQIAIAHGDEARASTFAARAYQTRLICEGADSTECKLMFTFAENPKKCRHYGTWSTKWKSTKDEIPFHLTNAEFADWLWRM